VEEDNKENDNVERYLLEGPQTKITENIKNVSNSIHGDDNEYIQQSFNWIRQNLKQEENKEVKQSVFRKRTADQIIMDQFSTGCSDDAIVFIAFMRAKGIPTKYIETVRKDSDGTDGHVFAECYLDGNWKRIDPAKRESQREIDFTDYDIVGVGLDSWDLEIGSSSDIIEKTSLHRKNINRSA
jgi:hypothetical protein